MTDKLVNVVLVLAIIFLIVIMIDVVADIVTFIFCESDIPFWIDYWRTNCGH